MSICSNSSILNRDQIENYFFFSSMDHPDALKECPLVKNFTRTHVHFGMHKFEYI